MSRFLSNVESKLLLEMQLEKGTVWGETCCQQWEIKRVMAGGEC